MGRPILQIEAGTRFGDWTVIGFAGVSPHRQGGRWKVLCSCGNERVVRGQLLRNGQSQSCGHGPREAFKTRFITHGHNTRNSGTYRSWNDMLQRCLNPNSRMYEYYGGRGITVCGRWLKFENFLADMGEKPEGKALDRKDNSKGYYKSNCRWATRKEQQNNTRTNFLIEYNGQTKTVSQWADLVGLKKATLYCRIKNYGWTVERALNTSV